MTKKIVAIGGGENGRYLGNVNIVNMKLNLWIRK